MRLLTATLLALTVIVSGCASNNIDDSESSAENFKLYISDQPVDIETFDYVNVTVSEAEAVLNNESQNFTVNSTVDLTQVVGDKREEVFSGNLPEGNYSGMAVEVENVEASNQGENVTVNIPSEKLRINSEFTVSDQETTEFVFDIHLVRRGQSGEYNLRPTVSESGPVDRNLVYYRDSGFEPDSITIEEGEEVTWIDESSSRMWVGSDQHPSHTEYDGTSLNDHCPSEDSFDSCGPVGRYSFTFNQTGEWGYHNHRAAGDTGTVVVE